MAPIATNPSSRRERDARAQVCMLVSVESESE